MLAIEIELLSDRYHATAWGQAANEGEAEWPPSPWRLARSLVSAWYRCPHDRALTEGALDSLIQVMAAPPRFLIPQGTVGHTRHYMPEATGKPTSSPVLDAFVRVSSPRLVALWDDVDLQERERNQLQDLLDGISYLGRAESPCIARLVTTPPQDLLTAFPLSDSDGDVPDQIVNVLCVSATATVADLSQSTAERRARGHAAPSAGRWVPYVLPARALEPQRVYKAAPRTKRPIHLMRFALDGAALPTVTDAVRIADLFRGAALRRVDDDAPEAIARIRGRAAGADYPLQGHQHCHYLPTDEDGDGRLDHMTVWCPDGLGPRERAALDVETLSSSWRLDHPLHLVLLEARAESDLPDAGPSARSDHWISHTPFIPTRHPKKRGGLRLDSFDEQVLNELLSRGFDSPISIEPLQAGRQGWGAYRRRRDSAPRTAHDLPALGWSIVFAQPVQGPISLGRNSHFGLGLFLPDGHR